MSISIQELQVAMETFGATRLKDKRGTRYNDVIVPCFEVADIHFSHSGSYYVVQRIEKASAELMVKAMAEFGEKDPGGYNFWYNEIHTVRGLLTLVLMLENRYSKELADSLTNETYKQLFGSTMLQNNVDVVDEADSQKMQELWLLLGEYHKLVNPFGVHDVKLKEPTEYLEKIKPGIGFTENSINLSLSTIDRSVSSTFNINKSGWYYGFGWDDRTQKSGTYGFTFTHCFEEENGCNPADEVISLYVYTLPSEKKIRNNDIRIRFSLKSGLVWKTNTDKIKPKPISQKQLEIIIKYLKKAIKLMKSEIIAEMVAGNL